MIFGRDVTRWQRWRAQAVKYRLLLALLGSGLGLLLVVLLADTGSDAKKITPPRAAEHTGITPSVQPHLAPARAPRAPHQQRRLPVAGARGFFVVLDDDGSGYLERPDGTRLSLAAAGELLTPVPPLPPEALAKKLPRAKTEVGQLLVLDAGIVDVPASAVVTYVGRDRVVAYEGGGVATVYYVDGRVERRGAAPISKP